MVQPKKPFELPCVGESEHNDDGVEEVAEIEYWGEDSNGRPIQGIESVRTQNEKRLMAIEGVQGVGTGSTDIGDDAIVVYLESDEVKGSIPSYLDGYPVLTEVVGEIDATGPFDVGNE